MANAVFTTKPEPSYDDLPELRYHFPERYIGQAEQTVGDWIVYYEPRRQGGVSSRASGRQSYFATARVARIERDPKLSGHYYAQITDYLEFTNPVPFKEGDNYYETGLKKDDGSTNRGRFGWNLRVIPAEEYQIICEVGFAGANPVAESPTEPPMLAEEPVPYGRSNRTVILERPFREAAFTRIVRSAYESTCAMTGLQLINGGGRCEIEAAHIKAVSDDGPDSPRNGIALSRTIHWMFDKHFLSISDTGEILVAKKYVPEPIRRLLNPDGKVRIPTSPSRRPHPVFLRYHQKYFKGD